MAKKETEIKVRVSEQMKARIEAYADQNDKTVSQVARDAITEYLATAQFPQIKSPVSILKKRYPKP